jgi:serine phosphatase RsbU (regulator of sigma subunit)
MQFCTVALAILEVGPQGAHIQIASGGHPLPVLLHSDGAAEEVGGYGTLLGAIPVPQFQDRRIELEPGDTLLFYTDGVTEAWAPQRVLSSDELRSVIASCEGDDADALATCVEDAVLEMGDADPRDDIAILALQVRGRRSNRSASERAAAVRS